MADLYKFQGSSKKNKHIKDFKTFRAEAKTKEDPEKINIKNDNIKESGKFLEDFQLNEAKDTLILQILNSDPCPWDDRSRYTRYSGGLYYDLDKKALRKITKSEENLAENSYDDKEEKLKDVERKKLLNNLATLTAYEWKGKYYTRLCGWLFPIKKSDIVQPEGWEPSNSTCIGWYKPDVMKLTDEAAKKVLSVTEKTHKENTKQVDVAIKKLSSAEKEAVNVLDGFLGKGNKYKAKNWQLLYDKYAEVIAEDNTPKKKADAEAFGDTTLKHQVFDYWEGPMRDGYDLAMMIAVYTGGDIEEAIKGLKK